MRGGRWNERERGFTLVETMCAILVLSLTLLLAAGLIRATQHQERRTQMEFAVSRVAVTQLESWRGGESLPDGFRKKELVLHGTPVTETIITSIVDDLTKVTLTYTWHEGGRPHEQTWATMFPATTPQPLP